MKPKYRNEPKHSRLKPAERYKQLRTLDPETIKTFYKEAILALQTLLRQEGELLFPAVGRDPELREAQIRRWTDTVVLELFYKFSAISASRPSNEMTLTDSGRRNAWEQILNAASIKEVEQRIGEIFKVTIFSWPLINRALKKLAVWKAKVKKLQELYNSERFYKKLGSK